MNDSSTIFSVWGDQEGYVSLPRKLRSPDGPKGPKAHAGKWEEKMFKWPEDQPKVQEWISNSDQSGYDLYWCPSVFVKPQRLKQNIQVMTALYADLDELPIDKLKGPKPTILWESSPGRYASVWMLKSPLSAQDGEMFNKRLTYHIGADKGGWDLTQVLRVPGLRNHKYEGSPRGKVISITDYKVAKSTLAKLPPVADELEEEDPEDILFESSTDSLLDLVRPFLTKLPIKTLELLLSSESQVLESDRSEKLWELECSLLEAGVPKDSVVQLVACSHWNKYKGRRDETRRILREVEKAADHVGDVITTASNSPANKFMKVITYDDLMSREEEQPGWMIEGIWQRNSHGMIAGEPKTYKSVIVTDMAVSVASGEPFLGRYPVKHQGPVIYIQEENSPWLVKDRLQKITHHRGLLEGKVEVQGKEIKVQMPPSLPLYFLNNQGYDLTDEQCREFLEGIIQEIKPALIIFDPLYLMLGGKDENSSKDIRPILNWLLKIRYDYKTSVIVLHHWNKSGKSDRGGQRMLGSVLWHGWVESAIYTNVVDEVKGKVALEREFRSFSKPPRLQAQFEFGAPGSYDYCVRTEDATPDSESDNPIISILESYQVVTEEDVKNMLGTTKRNAQEQLNALVKAGKILKTGNEYSLNTKLKGGNK